VPECAAARRPPRYASVAAKSKEEEVKMAWRESFNVEPMIHANPIPTAARTGNMLYTSVIGGRDLETGQVPADAEQQAVNAFAILTRVLERAGATAGDVTQVKVYIKEPGVRQLVNQAWLDMFPDEQSRPARHTVVDEDLGAMVQIEAIAVVQGWA
jgi:2-iminobutanoate/2-iminopropanoate deaminase